MGYAPAAQKKELIFRSTDTIQELSVPQGLLPDCPDSPAAFVVYVLWTCAVLCVVSKKELPGLCPHPFLFPTSGVFFQQYECDDHGLDSYHPYRKPGYHIWRQYAVICSQISPLTSMYAIGAEDGADDDADNTSSGQLSHSTLRQKIPSR